MALLSFSQLVRSVWPAMMLPTARSSLAFASCCVLIRLFQFSTFCKAPPGTILFASTTLDSFIAFSMAGEA